MGREPIRKEPLPPMYPGATVIGEEEKRAVMEVLDSQSLFRYYGPKFLDKTRTFEKNFAEYMGVRYALGVTSGTAALCAALVGAGIGAGDEVIVPAYTWIATPLAAVATKAVPIIAEVDKSLTLSPEDFESKITPRTKAVIPVHMRGIGCRMDEIMEIAREHDLVVIEDTAQSTGGSYKGKRLGSIGDFGTYSFQLNKVITAGEGGAVITNDERFYERCVMFHDVVALARTDFWREFKTDPIPGMNFRMNEITAAIMIEQLRKIDDLLSTMRENKRRIKEGVADVEGVEFREVPDPEGDTGICLFLFLPTAEKAQRFSELLRANNIDGPGYGTYTIYVPGVPEWHVYTSWKTVLEKRTFTKEGCPYLCPFYKGKVEYHEKMCPDTLDLLGRTVHMDVSPLLTDEDIDSIIEGIHQVAIEVSSV